MSRMSALPAVCLVLGCSQGEEPAGHEPTASVVLGTSASTVPQSAPPALTANEPSPEREAAIHSLRRIVWVRSGPSERSSWIGYLGLGGHATLASNTPLRGDECNTLYAVQPRGYVCLNHRTTLHEEDPTLLSVQHVAGDFDSPWPHAYGESRQAPRYLSIPPEHLQAERERDLSTHLAHARAMREGIADEVPHLLRGVDTTPAGQRRPAYLSMLPQIHEDWQLIPAGSSVTWVDSFDEQGRTWLVTGDGALLPKDRVAPYRPSGFHGVRTDDATPWPIAFVREKDRDRFGLAPDGSVTKLPTPWKRLEHVPITGRHRIIEEQLYLDTTAGQLIAKRDAVVVWPSAHTPWGDPVQAQATAMDDAWSKGIVIPRPSKRRTWIEVSLREGWMIAYEDTRPVFATLIAPGKGALRFEGNQPIREVATPPGVFQIQGKYLSATMAPGSTIRMDVPFAMPYFGAYAFHAAYWHDQWGEEVSMGCINLAPKDAKWLFDWAEPSLPKGWHGVTAASTGQATTVVVRL